MNGETLFTVFALLTLAANGALCFFAYKFCDRAEEAASLLRTTVGTTKANALSIEALVGAMQRLQGAVNRLKRTEYPATYRKRVPADGVDVDAPEPVFDDDDDDPEFRAALELQSAPAAPPGKRKG